MSKSDAVGRRLIESIGCGAAILVWAWFCCGGSDAQAAAQRDYRWNYGGHPYHLSLTFQDSEECQARHQKYWRIFPDYGSYVAEEPCASSMRALAERLKQEADVLGLNKWQAVNYLLNWVETIPYGSDLTTKGYAEYPRFPYQTVLDNVGDCEDFAILYSTILSYWCIDSALLYLPNHMVVGINGREFPEVDSAATLVSFEHRQYVYTDPTGCPGGRCAENKVGKEITVCSTPSPARTVTKVYRTPLICSVHFPGEGGNIPDADNSLAQIFQPRPRSGQPDDIQKPRLWFLPPGEVSWFEGAPRRVPWSELQQKYPPPKSLSQEELHKMYPLPKQIALPPPPAAVEVPPWEASEGE